MFNEPFPIGQAATNRIITLAKGIEQEGVKLELFVLRATESRDKVVNTKVKGVFDGILFRYIMGRNVRDDSKIRRILVHYFSVIWLFMYILKNGRKIDFIINPLDSLSLAILFGFLCKITGVLNIRAVDEYPPFVLCPYRYTRIYVWLYKKVFYRCFGATIVITKKLEEYFKVIAPKRMKFIHVPMTVDISRFDSERIYDNYITYCGNLGFHRKDGVDDLIEAFSLISHKYLNIKLLIIGSSNQKNELNALFNLVDALQLNDRVIFTGLVSSNDIPNYLLKSKLLVLARPNNKQAEGGFPTKLGEYLATGVPVVVTDVGEISYYLKDGVSAYIAKPSNVEDFAIKMDEALKDYQIAKKVGIEGKKVALDKFNYKQQGKRIVSFIISII